MRIPNAHLHQAITSLGSDSDNPYRFTSAVVFVRLFAATFTIGEHNLMVSDGSKVEQVARHDLVDRPMEMDHRFAIV